MRKTTHGKPHDWGRRNLEPV